MAFADSSARPTAAKQTHSRGAGAVIARSQRVRPEVAGPMTGSAMKQSRSCAPELDCFAGARNDGAFSRRARVRGLLAATQPQKDLPSRGKSRGRRSAERRIQPMSAHRRKVYAACANRLRAEAARCRGPLAFRRSTAALAKATERFGSAQAALHANERTRALPAPPIALKRSTPRPGHSAGGDDARAARERSCELRPQEPHPLHQTVATG